jgi:hypothetical protein
MIELHFNKNTYPMHNLWEELTADEFSKITPWIVQVLNGDITVQQCRVMAAFALTGMSPRRFRIDKENDQFTENIYRISQAVDFLFRIEYENQKAFTRLNKDVKAKLYRYLPEELDENQMPEVKWAKKQKYNVVPDLVFAKNLLPKIGKRSSKLNGYTFELNGKLLECSLSFIQLVDAQNLSAEYFSSSNDKILNRFIQTLYYPGDYDPKKVHTIQLPTLDALTKQAILFNFNAIQAFLYTRTKYRLLFDDSDTPKGTKKRRKGSSMGLMGMGYSLMKTGYQNVKEGPALEVFEIMYNELITTVTQLFNDGIAIDKISEGTKLSLRKINKILAL